MTKAAVKIKRALFPEIPGRIFLAWQRNWADIDHNKFLRKAMRMTFVRFKYADFNGRNQAINEKMT